MASAAVGVVRVQIYNPNIPVYNMQYNCCVGDDILQMWRDMCRGSCLGGMRRAIFDNYTDFNIRRDENDSFTSLLRVA